MTEDKHSILLVDDDNFLLQMYGMKFTSEGFTVQAVTSVSHALDILRQGLTPDAIAFDITMPEHDGFFLLDAIKREGLAPTAKKIALTNQQSEEEKAKALDMGADEYLIKATLIPSEVVTFVRNLIAR
jgi:DNA-binding response OmpR family regulator